MHSDSPALGAHANSRVPVVLAASLTAIGHHGSVEESFLRCRHLVPLRLQ